MTEKCIGSQNKQDIKDTSDRVRDLEDTVKDLKHKISNLEKNKVDSDTIHKMDMKLLELSRDIGEMKNNRTEDREQIAKLSESVENINCMIEEYLQGNAKLLIGQSRAEDKNTQIEKTILKICDQMEAMNKKIDSSSVIEQLKRFYHKSTLNKWIGRLTILLLGVFIASVFSFFMSGGSTFFEILNQWKELVM